MFPNCSGCQVTLHDQIRGRDVLSISKIRVRPIFMTVSEKVVLLHGHQSTRIPSASHLPISVQCISRYCDERFVAPVHSGPRTLVPVSLASNSATSQIRVYTKRVTGFEGCYPVQLCWLSRNVALNYNDSPKTGILLLFSSLFTATPGNNQRGASGKQLLAKFFITRGWKVEAILNEISRAARIIQPNRYSLLFFSFEYIRRDATFRDISRENRFVMNALDTMNYNGFIFRGWFS